MNDFYTYKLVNYDNPGPMMLHIFFQFLIEITNWIMLVVSV